MKEYSAILKQKVKKIYHLTAQKTIAVGHKVKAICTNDKAKYLVAASASTIRQIIGKMTELFNSAGLSLSKIGIKANQVSWFGFIIGIFAINFLAMGMYNWALAAILLNRLCDGLDGAIARATQITGFGVFLDATLDYIFYGGVIWGFALGNSAHSSAACFLMFAFTAAACAMLAYSVVAYKNNSNQELNLKNSPFYLGGIAQGFETVIVFVILCLFPHSFVPMAIILGILSLLKAFSVIVAAYYNFVIMERKS